MCVRPFGATNVYYICPVCKEMHHGCAQCLDILGEEENSGAWTCTSCGRLFCAYCYCNFPVEKLSGAAFRCHVCAARCSSTRLRAETTNVSCTK